MRLRRRHPDVATCRETGQALQTYLDGELDDLSARRIAAHLDMCRRCGMAAATYTEIKAALARKVTSVDNLALRRLRGFADDLAAGHIAPPIDDDADPAAPA